MSGVIDCGHYDRKICANCEFYWDHLLPDFSKMSEFEKMFYINVEYCPNCHYVNESVDKLDQVRKKDVESKKYEDLMKSYMPRFGITTRTEAFPYIAFSKMCQDNKDYYRAALSYYQGIKLEEEILNNFVNSEMFTSGNDNNDVNSYKQRIKSFYDDCEWCIKKFISTNNEIKAKIFLCGLLKKRNKLDEMNAALTDLIKNNKFDKTQILVLREIKGV